MSGKPAPTPLQQLPPLDYILALTERLLLFKNHPVAKLGLEHARSAEKLYRKDLKLIVDAQVDGSASPAQVIDVRELEGNLAEDSTTFARLLRRAGLRNEVSSALENHKGTLAIAEALLSVAKSTRDDLVSAMAKRIDRDRLALDDAQKREAAGGHPAFDLETSRVAKQCWTHLDMATHLLGACLLEAGVVNDSTYLAQPTVKSVLRPVLVAPQPQEKKPGKKAGKKTDRKKKDGSGQSQNTDGGAPATANPG